MPRWHPVHGITRCTMPWFVGISSHRSWITGRVEIDNNLIDNRIRPIALGRKNYLFAGSHAAAQRADIQYSLLITCALHGVNPVGAADRQYQNGFPRRPKKHATHRCPINGRRTKTNNRKSRLDQSSCGLPTSEKANNQQPCQWGSRLPFRRHTYRTHEIHTHGRYWEALIYKECSHRCCDITQHRTLAPSACNRVERISASRFCVE